VSPVVHHKSERIGGAWPCVREYANLSWRFSDRHWRFYHAPYDHDDDLSLRTMRKWT
jgi:hypothetical protein